MFDLVLGQKISEHMLSLFLNQRLGVIS